MKGPLPLDQVLQYAIEIADALDKAHRKGITHRDLKPGNIMLTKSGTKLLDFGLAKLTQAASRQQILSRSYRPPSTQSRRKGPSWARCNTWPPNRSRVERRTPGRTSLHLVRWLRDGDWQEGL